MAAVFTNRLKSLNFNSCPVSTNFPILHYSFLDRSFVKTSMQYTVIFTPVNIDHFQIISCDIFHTFVQSIDCAYLFVKMPHWPHIAVVILNPQLMLSTNEVRRERTGLRGF